MSDITLKIDGMSCQHCVMGVKEAIDKIEGVSSSNVSVGNARIVFDESKTTKVDFVKAVQDAGYKVVG
jgi:copper chaperone CopZ